MIIDEEFEEERQRNIQQLAGDSVLNHASKEWLLHTLKHKYCYNFSWAGLPIIQYPQDIIAIQEIIWQVRPELIIETGIARGGSLVFHASMLELIGGQGEVLGIDIDIRAHNRRAIEAHPMAKRIRMLQGSSIDSAIIQQVNAAAAGKQRILVILDSNHTHAHVLAEMQAYAPLVKNGSYLLVLDTIIEDLPEDTYPDRPWAPGDNPKTAVLEYLRTNDRFVIDADIDAKLQISVAPCGYLKCIKD